MRAQSTFDVRDLYCRDDERWRIVYAVSRVEIINTTAVFLYSLRLRCKNLRV